MGRQEQVERVIKISGRRTKNNPCLIGEAGVGKQLLFKVLLKGLPSGRVPEILDGKVCIKLFTI